MAVVRPKKGATLEDIRTGEVQLNVGQSGSIRTIGGFGNIRFGVSGFGIDSYVGGVYQARRHNGRKFWVKMKYYRPTDPKTDLQQANRQKMADAVASWQALPESEKNVWRERGKKLRRKGYNLYISGIL